MVIRTERTYNWSPLKSPNAITLPSASRPIDPASVNEFPEKRFGGNGHIAAVGSASQDNEKSRVVHDRCVCLLGQRMPDVLDRSAQNCYRDS